MIPDQNITLYHGANTRSTGALILLEELGVNYQLHVLNMKAGEQRKPEYLATYIRKLNSRRKSVTHYVALIYAGWRSSITP